MNFSRPILLTVPLAAALAIAYAHQPDSTAPYASESQNETPTDTLPPIVVTAIREEQPLGQVPASVGVLKPQTIRFAAPSHAQQLLGQVPGVALSATNGEGHTTAIRQPFSTSPLYLFLEDGIPVRPTGFFNHNALYELNIPQAGGVEVIRGPGSALYGSDGIGGIVNVLSASPGERPELTLNSEGGSFGWFRFLGSAQTGQTRLGKARLDINTTHSDGWRRQTGYDRRGGNLRWDYALDEDTTLKTIVGYTRIDQKTGANSALGVEDYRDNPRRNLFSIAYRKVEALRISSAFEKAMGDARLSLTPYFRRNAMELSGSFNLPNDARLEKTDSHSYGLLAKWRQDFPSLWNSRLILGLDLERSPGRRIEDEWITRSTAVGSLRNYTGYTTGARIYDYDVSFRSVSPYLHGEISPLEKLRVTAGLRYDRLGFGMKNRLQDTAVRSSAGGAAFWGQSPSTDRDFSRVVPKVGVAYEFDKKNSIYASYNQAYRVPSESQLFRGGKAAAAAGAQARSANALELKPILAEQYEVGARGQTARLDYSLAVYHLTKSNDLVSWRDTATNVSTNLNAGKTRSRGVEAGLGWEIVRGLRIDSALSYAKHEYVEWVNRTGAASFATLSGNEMPQAPRFMGNTRLTFSPADTFKAQVEWVRIGSYFLQDSNLSTTAGADRGVSKYNGHDLLNVRMSYDLCANCTVFARVLNVADRRYAESASVTSSTAVYVPGLPRAFFAGVELKF